MPYEFKLVRKVELDNSISLIVNKKIAENLLTTFEEVYDPYGIDSEYYYLNREINPESDNPEFHFELYADFEYFSFIIHFWQDSIYFEFSAGHVPEIIFEQLEYLAEVVIRYDFLVDDPKEDKLWDLTCGVQRHIPEYKRWSGIVDQIIEHLNKEE